MLSSLIGTRPRVGLVHCLGLDGSVLDKMNCRGFSAGENREFTKVSTGGIEARFWSKDSG